jgi:hypothetical protein
MKTGRVLVVALAIERPWRTVSTQARKEFQVARAVRKRTRGV